MQGSSVPGFTTRVVGAPHDTSAGIEVCAETKPAAAFAGSTASSARSSSRPWRVGRTCTESRPAGPRAVQASRMLPPVGRQRVVVIPNVGYARRASLVIERCNAAVSSPALLLHALSMTTVPARIPTTIPVRWPRRGAPRGGGRLSCRLVLALTRAPAPRPVPPCPASGAIARRATTRR